MCLNRGSSCGIQEGGEGLTAGKLFLLTTSYGSYWVVIALSQMLHFAVILTMSHSYPATPNGPHMVEVCLRRLTWYPAIAAVSMILPTLYAWMMHQHQTMDVPNDVLYGGLFVFLSRNFIPILASIGILQVEIFIGRRDRSIVKADPLIAKPPPRENLNIEDAPANTHGGLIRDRFWLTMNVNEDRKWLAPVGSCSRCNTHSHRQVVKFHTLEEEQTLAGNANNADGENEGRQAQEAA